MKIKIIILILLLIYINIYARVEDTSTINDVEYNINLIKFYIEKNEYDNALEYIDKTLEEAALKDSLYYFKGVIFQQKEDWLKASEFFTRSILYTSDEQIILDRLVEFELVIFQVSPLSAFDIVSSAVTKAQTSQKQTGFLNILAKLYENNQLYGEANDVYKTILTEAEDTEKCDLQIKIATNRIFQKNYRAALNILDPLITLNDSLHLEKLLFLNYIANISIKNHEDAKSSLIRLYLDFPNNANRDEILAGLADIFEFQEQYLASWFMLNELFKISNEAQKFKILADIERIKKKICEINTIEDQFKHFEPVFNLEKHRLLQDDAK
jgi:tetratricopeptide (TPR) repeat protein